MHILTVAELMTRDPVKVSPETNLLDCAKVMIKKRVGSLLLVKEKKLFGLISRRDILWALVKKSKQDLSNIKAIDISPRKIATAKPSLSLEQVISKMKKFKFKTLPVIHNGKLVGIITMKDILNFHPKLYHELEKFQKIKEETEKLKRIKEIKKKVYEGFCEQCGKRDLLVKVDGMLLCAACRNAR